MECWRWEWCWIHGEFGEHGEVIRWRAVGRKSEGVSEESEEVITKSRMKLHDFGKSKLTPHLGAEK